MPLHKAKIIFMDLIKNNFIQNFFNRLGTSIFLAALYLFLVLIAPLWLFIIFFVLILIYLLIYEWPILYSPKKRYFYPVTIFYLILPILLIIKLQAFKFWKINLLLFASVSVFDTGSYVFGSIFGKNRLWQNISPGKTLQGLLGGILCLFILFYLVIKPGNNFMYFMTAILALIISLASFAGDLFESWLKRRANVKDSGKILLGHGGILDRFDSFSFSVYIFYLLRNYLLFLIN